MTYNNPQITKLDGAIKAIQNIDTKNVPRVTDTFILDPRWPQPTILPAYQADE